MTEHMPPTWYGTKLENDQVGGDWICNMQTTRFKSGLNATAVINQKDMLVW